MQDVIYVNSENLPTPSKDRTENTPMEPSQTTADDADKFLKSISSEANPDPQNLGRISSVSQRSKGIIRTVEEAAKYPIRDTTPQYPSYGASKQQLDKEFEDLMKEDSTLYLPDDIKFKDLQLRADGRPLLFPKGLWKYLSMTQRPLVKYRWAIFPTNRLEEVLVQIRKLDIDPSRPILRRYTLAQCYANCDVFANIDEDFPAAVKGAKFTIATTDEKPEAPGKKRHSAFTEYERAFLDAKLRVLERKGMITRSTSEWCAGVMLVPYTFRLTIDYRMLNAKTVKDLQPIGRVDEEINLCAGKNFFTTSDVMDAFWAIECDPLTRHKTAFRGHNQVMEWLRMPQGASNSGPVFTRVMRGAFEHIPRERGSTFVDDLSVHGINFLEHMGTMQLVFDTLREINVKIKPSKTHCNYTEVRKLGHLVSAVGRRIDPERVRAILEMAQPKTIEQLESFLGMFPYNQEYLKGIYITLRPLYDLKSKRSTGQWSEEHTEAFRQAKLILSNIPILLNPDTTKKFYIEVDACTRGGRGMGAVLKQKDDNGLLRPVAYWSHALTDRERESYSASMAEARALHDSILFWGVYLRHGPAFEVACDHKALIYMLTTSVRTANRVVMRYILDLQEYNFSLHYCKGSLNIEADAVSRLLRYDDESIFFPKTADELRDDHGPLITKSENYMAKQMMSDWLWLYPEVCWRDSFGKPLDPKTTIEQLGITDDDLLPPIPRKQRGRPKRVQPTVQSIGLDILEQQLVRDVVSDVMEELVNKVKEKVDQMRWLPEEMPFSTIPTADLETTLDTCRVNMARRSQRVQEQLDDNQEHFDEEQEVFLKHPQSHSSMTRAKAERTRTMLLGNRDSHPEIEKWKWMLGRVYEDFDNHRLYEVIYIYYDNREQRVCGYSRSMDDAPADPQDVFPIFCEGPECLEEMIRAFESIHGPTGERIEWPATQDDLILY
jgi:RNase H-like domain found in reverse transcriptase/Reverse transcriptase (RNA-dependent DNA polymerase)